MSTKDSSRFTIIHKDHLPIPMANLGQEELNSLNTFLFMAEDSKCRICGISKSGKDAIVVAEDTQDGSITIAGVCKSCAANYKFPMDTEKLIEKIIEVAN